MKKKSIIIIVVLLITITVLGISKADYIKKIIHQTTSQPEDAPFRHM